MRSPVSTINSASCVDVLLRLHERARTRLHIEHQHIDTLGQLLAHDRSANQSDVLDGPGRIAQRIDFFVRGRDFRSLPDQPHAAFAQHACEIDPASRFTSNPGIDSSLSSVPPVWPSPRPLIIGTVNPPRRNNRRKNQRSIVADATRRVLIHLFPRQSTKNRAPRPNAASLRSAPPSRHATSPRSHEAISHAAI